MVHGILQTATQTDRIRMIAIDMDGTLLGEDGQVSPHNLAALLAAESAGIEIVIATGRRHCYAMHILRPLGLHHASALISSNGTVTRTLGSFGAEPIASQLIAHTHLPYATTTWLCGHVEEFRNALVLTFDRVGPDGEDSRGALVVEDLDQLNASIGRWMIANEPYIAHVRPIEDVLVDNGSDRDAPIQAMLCGTIERMTRAEARLLEHPGVHASGQRSGRSGRTMNGRSGPFQSVDAVLVSGSAERAATIAAHNRDDSEAILTLHRTEYPGRDLSILDILPAGCSKGAAILSLAAMRGIDASEIMAIGDNWNDVSMLEVAGAAVLMGNAPDDLKVLARRSGWRIGLCNHEDGVADAIETVLATSCEAA